MLRQMRQALASRAGYALALLMTGPVLTTLRPFARLANYFGISEALAATIVSLIVTDSWEISFFFPYVIPVEATVGALVAAFGVGYAAYW
jgi:type III secretory pathway component EscT